jgi:DNA-binding transcriptional regulator YdaS (Cro superfamily)
MRMSAADGAKPAIEAGLQAAIEAAGNRHALARGIGADPGGVHRWKRVPAERVAEIEEVYGVPRAVLRPDLFGE